MIKLEETIGCYRKGAFTENDPLYPEKYRDLSNKATSHFSLLYKWIIFVSLFIILIIWKTNILSLIKFVLCKQ